jgi:hypothetical protein
VFSLWLRTKVSNSSRHKLQSLALAGLDTTQDKTRTAKGTGPWDDGKSSAGTQKGVSLKAQRSLLTDATRSPAARDTRGHSADNPGKPIAPSNISCNMCWLVKGFLVIGVRLQQSSLSLQKLLLDLP